MPRRIEANSLYGSGWPVPVITSATRKADDQWLKNWICRTADHIHIQARGDASRQAALLRRVAEVLTAGAHDLLASHLGVAVAEAYETRIVIAIDGRVHKEFEAGALRDELRVALISSVEMMLDEQAFRDYILGRPDPFALPEFESAAVELATAE